MNNEEPIHHVEVPISRLVKEALITLENATARSPLHFRLLVYVEMTNWTSVTQSERARDKHADVHKQETRQLFNEKLVSSFERQTR